MDKTIDITLKSVCDLLFEQIRGLMTREGNTIDFEFFIHSTAIQEIFYVVFPDDRGVFIKIFPHKNYLGSDVFRLEFFMTQPGDKRGNRVSFTEIESRNQAETEIPSLIERIMINLILDGKKDNS
ncbi:MAG: hypothetical protein HQM08_02665 [Candidatus Riflebacteria bacterium]|nr:hypothetical protein [Candidatus Riflebacteria bacterium]